MRIEQSLDWQEVSTKLRNELHNIGYNPDLLKMHKNIEKMISELSKLEVTGRRLHNNKFLIEPIEKINKSIDHLEKLILMAKLMM